MRLTACQGIKDSLRRLYLDDPRPWLVDFSGGERMEKLVAFCETLQFYRDPANGKRDMKRKSGSERPVPLYIEARRELLTRLLNLQEISFREN